MGQRRTRIGSFARLFLLLVALLALYFFMHSSIFEVHRVVVRGNHYVPEQEIIRVAGVKCGTNIFDLKVKAIEEACTVIPRIKKAEIHRVLPHTVEIDVWERKAIAVLVKDADYFLVDSEGVCLDRLWQYDDGNGLPFITIEGLESKVAPGHRLDPAAVAALFKVIKTMPLELASRISEYHYTKDGEVLVYTLGGTEVRIGSLERLPEKINLLRDILMAKGSFGDGELMYVDLRYEGHPVVRSKLD